MRVQVLRSAPCSVSSAVEQRFCKAQVAGSIPCTELQFALLAHSVERRFGRAEAAGAEPAESSTRSWWNGRHNGFRSRRRKTWEFKSLRAHQCPCGGMADAAVSKAAVFRDVQVRVLLGAPIRGCGGNARRRTLKPSRISDACGLDSHLPHQCARAPSSEEERCSYKAEVEIS